MITSRIILIAYDQQEGSNHIKENKLNRNNVTIVTKSIQLNKLSKGHKILKTKLAYINPNINDILSELTVYGYSISL